jgi:hypothetical protein
MTVVIMRILSYCFSVRAELTENTATVGTVATEQTTKRRIKGGKRQEGRKEKRKEGRKEERKEGRKEKTN